MRSWSLIRQIGDMGRVNAMTPAEVTRLQDARLREMLRHAIKKSPYYRERLRGIDIERCAVTDLPTLTKEGLMENFDRIVTDPRLKSADLTTWLSDTKNLPKLYLDRYIAAKSSGSSGVYSIGVHDLDGLNVLNAAFFTRSSIDRRRVSPGDQMKQLLRSIFIKRVRLAVIAMTGVPTPSYMVGMFTPPLMKVLGERRFFSTMDPLDRLVASLNEYQPDALFAYPSVMELLAQEKIAGRLHLTLDSPNGYLMTGSEPLTQKTRELARLAWGKEIQDLYGALECIVIGRSCERYDRMHVMNDLCLLEIVDEHNRPVPAGQRGDKVLVTNLFNKIQPLIRFELTDVSGFSTEPCGCSWPFPTLLSVDGRTDDIFHISRPGGGYQAIEATRFFFIYTFPNLAQSQLLQTGRDEVTFKYVPVKGVTMSEDEVRRLFDEDLRKADLFGRIAVKIERVDAIPRQSRSGKYRQIMSVIGPPTE
jgi:phenylacetate-coenzyme A ligase PaaK-like adenylate-forming protein